MADIEKTVVTKMTLDASQPEKVLKDVEKGQKKLGDTTKKTAKETKDYSGALQGVTGKLGQMSGAGGTVVSSLGGMTKGMNGLKLAMAALPILALVAAVTALSTWFNRTAEGQEKLAVITAGFAQLLETFLDIVSGVGEALFNAFQNPKQAISDLLEFIKQNLINRVLGLGRLFKALGTTIKAAFKLDKEGVIAGLAEIGGAATQFATGLDAAQQESILGKINDQFVKLKANIEAATGAQRTANDLRRAQIAFTVRQAELRTTINEQLLIANDREKSLADRAEAAAAAEAAQNELIDEKIRLKNIEIQIAREQDAINDSNLDDAQALANLDAELIALSGERAQGLKRIQALRQTITKEAKTERDTELAELRSGEQEFTDFMKAQAEERAANQKEIDEQAAEDKAAAEERLQKALGKALTDGAKFSKELAIAQAVINMAESISASAKVGFPAAFVTVPIAIATGLAQISAIKSQSIPSTFARGGLLRGALHSQGGIRAELEDGEAVLNRRSMADPFLRQMASDINQAGGGVAFAQQGMLAGQAQLNSSIIGFGDQVERSLRQQRTVLVTEDLEAVQNRVFVTENTAQL